MKEFKFNANLRPSSISPADGNYSTYMQAREKIQNMQGLFKNVNPHVEVIIRVRDPRQDWIDEWYAAAKVAEQSGEIFVKFCKDATFVCAYGTASHQDIACAAPRHGDKYDQRTGIAVAYAKFCDAEIPDCI